MAKAEKEAANKSNDLSLARKVSVKTLGLDKAQLTELVMSDKRKTHMVARIIGKCARAETKETDLGTSLKLRGVFRGINLLTGETVQAGSCYLPTAAAELIESVLVGSEGSAVAIEFAFDIGVKFDATAATSYVYDCKPLMDMAGGSDPLAAIEARIPTAKALPAPKG